MTDGKGETVYFSDTLIIFTSNLGMYREERDPFGNVTKKPTVFYGDDGCNEKDPDVAAKKYDEYAGRIMNSINEFFTTKIERPELKNRIGENFIVFDYISYASAAKIAEKQVNAIIDNLRRQKNIRLTLSSEAGKRFMDEIVKLENISQGGRGVGNIVENMILRPLAVHMAEKKMWNGGSINIKNFACSKGNWSLVCDG